MTVPTRTAGAGGVRGAFVLAALAGALLAGCAGARRAAPGPATFALAASDGAAHTLALGAPAEAGVRATVVTFFAAECPVQAAHDVRLRALHAKWASRGVAFYAVDSEAGASAERAAAAAAAHQLPFPILADPRGEVADALGAKYATYSVVLDAAGAVRYRGGIDGDRIELHEGTEPWLDRAVGQVLAGEAPDPAATKTLGCMLHRE